MTTRILPPVEWGRLEETGLKGIWQTWTPEDTRVCVSESADGHIVDHWVAIRFWHLEALRVSSGSFRPLWRAMAAAMRALDVKIAWTGAEMGETKVHRMITRMGGTLVPIDHFVIPVSSPSRKAIASCRS